MWLDPISLDAIKDGIMEQNRVGTSDSIPNHGMEQGKTSARRGIHKQGQGGFNRHPAGHKAAAGKRQPRMVAEDAPLPEGMLEGSGWRVLVRQQENGQMTVLIAMGGSLGALRGEA